MPLRPLLYLAAFALCALGACDKTPIAQGASGAGGSAADGGGGAAAAPSGDAGQTASTAGSSGGGGKPDKPQGGSSAPSGGKSGSAGVAAHGGTSGPQGGDGASAGEGGSPAAGTGGDSAQAGAGGDAGSSAAGGGTGGSGGAGGSAPMCEPDALCVGPTIDSSACGLSPATSDVPLTDTNCPGKRTCQGAAAPHYRLTDFQGSTSCGTHGTYGLDAFVGRTTLVCIFATWCPYCQMQTEKLDQLRLELQQANKDIYIVVINQTGYEESQAEFSSRTSVPLLQDVASVGAWGLHGAEKDDLLIYRADGTLEAWLQPGQPSAPIDLTTNDGYAYVKMRLMSAP